MPPDPTIELALDTISKNKQALVFANTKRSAEKAAEDISRKTKNIRLPELSKKILNVLSRPTKQCERLARCIENGIAFHHAGLKPEQKDLIETAFKEGKIKIICATPTLAMGIDLPAYRTILKDLRRYGRHGLDWIPVLEYLQMSGRAGRPKYDNEGQSIAIAKTPAERDEIIDRYINGSPEDVFSKLAVEPVLRTYVLSLIASGFVRNEKQLLDFFGKTFWAYQYGDLEKLGAIIRRVLKLLEGYGFITMHGGASEFVSASDLNEGRITATALGTRVSQLYLDPLTAYKLICSMSKAVKSAAVELSYIHAVCHTLEMRPHIGVRAKEYDALQEQLAKYEQYLLEPVPGMFEEEYTDFLGSLKTAFMLKDWIEENDEEFLLEKYNIRPGEVHAKRENADWLLYSSQELAKLIKLQPLLKELSKLRVRMKYGAKEELLPLLRLKDIGRIRARKLFKNRLTTIKELRQADIVNLAGIIGKAAAESVKKQLGVDISKMQVMPDKRKGQIGLEDY